MRKNALITGATSGIGKAIAQSLAKKGFQLIITGRRKDRLLRMKEKLTDCCHVDVHAAAYDIRDKHAAKNEIERIHKKFDQIHLLVNNAGLALGLDDFHEGKIGNWEQMIDTNLKGLLYTTRIIAEMMVRKKEGHIINIGSVAGKQAYAKSGVYCATKHAVEALTKSMRQDFLPHGIKVNLISPGTVRTEFSFVKLKDREKAEAVYKQFKPLEAEDIADVVDFMVSRPKHVSVNDVFIMPTERADAFHVLLNNSGKEFSLPIKN